MFSGTPHILPGEAGREEEGNIVMWHNPTHASSSANANELDLLVTLLDPCPGNDRNFFFLLVLGSYPVVLAEEGPWRAALLCVEDFRLLPAMLRGPCSDGNRLWPLPSKHTRSAL